MDLSSDQLIDNDKITIVIQFEFWFITVLVLVPVLCLLKSSLNSRFSSLKNYIVILVSVLKIRLGGFE